jgi:2-keto-myo-inositol isomerase
LEIGYNEATCKELSTLERDIELAEKCGFTAIELRFDMVEKYLASKNLNDLKELFNRHSIRPVTINAIFAINFASEHYWGQIEQKVEFACRIADATKADTLLALPTIEAEPPKYSPEEIKEDTVKSLERLAALGCPHGIRIAFEPLGYKNSCIRNILDSYEIIKSIDKKEVGLAIDAYNLYHWRHLEDLDDLKSVPPEKIFIVHLNDAKKIPAEKLGTFDRVLPGDGMIDCVEYLKTVFSTGYNGVVSVEILSSELWAVPPEILIPQSYEKAKKVIFAAGGGKNF